MADERSVHKAHLIWVVALAALAVDVAFALLNKFGINVTKFAVSSKTTA